MPFVAERLIFLLCTAAVHFNFFTYTVHSSLKLGPGKGKIGRSEEEVYYGMEYPIFQGCESTT